jgi:hypothetical protein
MTLGVALLGLCVLYVLYQLLSKLIDARQYRIPTLADYDQPRPVDLADPPRYLTVVRTSADPEMRCTCHGKPVNDGDRILYWPTPAQILCAPTRDSEQGEQ